MFFRSLGGLLRKNYLLKKRSWVTSVCEIFLPVLMMLIMIGLRSLIKVEDHAADLHVNATKEWKGDYWIFPDLLKMTETLYVNYNDPATQIINNIYSKASQTNTPIRLDNFTSNTELMSIYYRALRNHKIAFTPGPSANESYVKEMANEFNKRYGFLANGDLVKYYPSATTLDDYVSGSDYGKSDELPYLLAGIVIHSSILSSHQYSYEIRMNASSPNQFFATTINSRFTPFKNDVHWEYQPGFIDTFFDKGYLFLQNFVEDYILSQVNPSKAFNRRLTVAPFPTHLYKSDSFPSVVGNLLSLLFTLAYLWPVTQLIKSIVQEKETKIKEGMKMMGLSEASLYLSWLITYSIIFGLTALLITLVTLSVFPHSNKGYIFAFFWLFGLVAFSFCYMVSCFFSKARVASNVGSVGFLATFLLFYAIGSTASIGTRAAACLSAPICFGMTAQHIASMESSEVGIRASSVNTNLNNFTFNTGMGMLIVDFFLYTFIGLYFSRVIQGDYGLAEKWYFCITPKFWFPAKYATKSHTPPSVANNPSSSVAVNDLMEPVSSALNPAVRVDRLRKAFEGSNSVQVAVKDLSIDLYEGQIFVLLGHNGAGKTTTISMLTGMLPPSSGDAYIYGNSIALAMESIRKQLGVCPQHNILFDELTVKEHLDLYAKIKGIPADQCEGQIKEIIEQVGLADKVNVYSKALSGGMQRKLSLAIALIGDSKVVFLDEPTSGMDPFSRRFTWDLLKKKKEGRVIILTTHFMDEADQLGDRIAIMHGGEIKCCGSSLFLKSKYGVGYTLTITKVSEKDFDEKSVSQAVLTNISNSELLSNVAGEISFRLPLAASSSFAALFDFFDSRQQSFGISSYGISVTTLEEVFLRVGHDEAANPHDRALNRQFSARRQKELSNSDLQHPKDITDDEPDIMIGEEKKTNHSRAPSPASNMKIDVRKRGDSMSILEQVQVRDIDGSMFFSHVDALVRKRAAAAYRDRKTWFCTVICPALLMFIGLSAITFAAQYTFPSIILSTERFDNPNVISFAAPTPTDDFSLFTPAAIAKESNNRFFNIPQQTNLSFSFRTDDPYQYNDRREMAEYLFNSFPSMKESRYSALLSNAKYSPLTNTIDDVATLYTNTTATYGLQIIWNYYNNLYLRWMTGNNDATITLIDHPFPYPKSSRQLFNAILAFFLAIAFSFIPIGFIAYVVKEETDKVKHQQLLSGVSNTAYWISNYIWDFINYLFPALICLILLAIFNTKEYIGENAGGTILVLLLYGISVIPFTYSLSFFFKNHVSAMIVVMLLYIVLSAILLTISSVLDLLNSSTANANKHLKFLFRLFPPFCFAESVNNMMIRTSRIQGGVKGLWQMDVLGWPLTYMTLEAFGWFVVVLIIEKIRYTPELLNKFTLDKNLPEEKFSDEDEDVIRERERLLSQPDPTAERIGDMITMKGLRKVYPAANGQPPKTAVHSLHLGIPEGQCFGYLGINGAGKTTTMKMLTGDILPSFGHAYLNGLDIESHQMEVRRLIGYCPQFDALIDTLTGREHLLLFARIKGVKEKQLNHYVDKLIEKIGLQEGIADKATKGYSGGNKRKICVGIALIGNPPIVFLDEPSTGMDPGSRRFMWDLIASTMKGRSVILTTHSMEECEALCHRIGVMVGGRLRCVGTIQHLRSRFGADYQFDVHLSPSVNEQQINAFHAWIHQQFPLSKLLESHSHSMKIRIPKESDDGTKLSIANMFRLIEKEKHRFDIADYSVSETSLEQIFIHFAKQQQIEEEKNAAMPGSIPDDPRLITIQVTPIQP